MSNGALNNFQIPPTLTEHVVCQRETNPSCLPKPKALRVLQ